MPIRTIHDISRQTVSSLSDNESNSKHQHNIIQDQNNILNRENMVPCAGKVGNYNTVVDTLIQNTFIIPTLPNGTTTAKDMLQRIVREFAPIIQQRNYNIVSVSELCCCSDGLSHKKNQSIGNTNTNTNTTNNNKRRRQPITIKKKRNQNLWGYNRSSYRTDGYGNNQTCSHEIHIRLRCFNDHTKMLEYDDIAGTMAHELAHCEVSPHNDKFYKVMDSIIDQHAALLSSNLTTTSQYNNRQPLIPFTGTGYKVGNTGTYNDSNTNTNDTNHNEISSTTLLFNPFTGAGTKLGGDTVFTQFMTPKEAAVVAADARRRQQQIRLRIQNQIQQYYLQQQKQNNRNNNNKTQNDSNSNDDTAGCCGTVGITIDDDDNDDDDDIDQDDDAQIDLEAKSQKYFSDNNETAFCQPCGTVKSNATLDIQQRSNTRNNNKKSEFKNSDNLVVLLDDDDDDRGNSNSFNGNDRPAATKSYPNSIPKQASSTMSSIAARAANTSICIDLTEDNYNEETSTQKPLDGTTINAGIMKSNNTTTLSQVRKNQTTSRKSFSCEVCTFLNWYSNEDCQVIRQTNDAQIVQCEMCNSDNYLH